MAKILARRWTGKAALAGAQVPSRRIPKARKAVQPDGNLTAELWHFLQTICLEFNYSSCTVQARALGKVQHKELRISRVDSHLGGSQRGANFEYQS